MGKIENELLLKFGMCVALFAPGSLGIAQKAMRSVDPRYARNNHDAKRRQKRREKLLRETIDPTTIPLSSIFPGFGFHPGIDPAAQTAVTVSVAELEAFAQKVIKGTTWVVDGRYIEADYEIGIHFVRDRVSFPFYEPLKKYGKTYSLGSGLTVVRAVPDEDHLTGLYYIKIWQQVFLYGSVTRAKSLKNMT
jgi:hypothetical protein